MRGLTIFCGYWTRVLPNLIHPCPCQNFHLQHTCRTWGPHSLCLRLPAILPSVLWKAAKFSGKAGKKAGGEFSENAMGEARQVLQDYLHYTRSLPFADAKYISLNAPFFVQKLLSTVQTVKDKSKALERYLRYNPINEFEPFFESIGVQPSDICGFLPVDKIFLSESQVLLANVSTLRNNGFHRQELGKLYKERPEIFSCSTGNLQRKLQFYEKLGLSKVSLVRILTCCPSLLADDVYREFETVVNGVNGFQLEKNRICCLIEENPFSCSSILEKLMLFAGLGCPWDDISRFYRTKPRYFFEISEKALYSLVDFLSGLGFRKEHIGSIIVQCPEVLKWQPSRAMTRNLGFGIVDFDKEKLRDMILKHPHVLGTGGLMDPIEKANGAELEEDKIPRGMKEHHRITMSWTLSSKITPEQLHNAPSEGADPVNCTGIHFVRGWDKKHCADAQQMQSRDKLGRQIPRHKVNFLLKLGLQENSDQMIRVAKNIRGGGDKLQERFDCLVGLGLPFDVVCKMVKSCPRILNQGADLIRRKADFLCSIGCPLYTLKSFPAYFTYDLEYRIKPRYKLCAWLKKNNVLKQEYSVVSIIAVSEKRFVRKYVSLHPEGAKYFRLYKQGQL